MSNYTILSAEQAENTASFCKLEKMSLSYDPLGIDIWPYLTITFSDFPHSTLQSTLLFVEVRQFELKLENAKPDTEEVSVQDIAESGLEGIRFRVISELGTLCFSFYCREIQRIDLAGVNG